MAPQHVVDIVRGYLAGLPRYGLHPVLGVVFGSYGRGDADDESDIDVLVVAPEFDNGRSLDDVEKLWLATDVDRRIEPVACGVSQWREDQSSPLIEVARREGVVVELPSE